MLHRITFFNFYSNRHFANLTCLLFLGLMSLLTPCSIAVTQPDLIPQSETVSPNPVTAGNALTVSYTVRNQGAGNAAATNTKVRIVDASNVLVVEQVFATIALTAGQSTNESRSITIPAGTTTGSYTVKVIVDNYSAVSQSSTANDIISVPVTVNVLATPSISSISPGSIVGSNTQQQVVINGANFQSGAKVKWKLLGQAEGLPRDATFNSSSQLLAFPRFGNDPGQWSVTVLNPNGQQSPWAQVNVQSPLPVVLVSDPPSRLAGSGTFVLKLSGDTFASNATIKWNGAMRTTTPIYDSANTFVVGLSASIAASDIVSAGTAQVTVYNPNPGGGTSVPVAFQVTNPAITPVVTLASLPSQLTSGQLVSASWAISNGVNITHSNIHWDPTDPEHNPQSNCAPASASCSSLIKSNGLRAQTDTFTAPPAGTYKFTVHAIVDGIDYYSQPWNTVVVTPAVAGAPSVSITPPANPLFGTISISGNAYDDKAVYKIEVQVDTGTFAAASGTGQWTFGLNTLLLSEGTHILTARATDFDNYSRATSVQIVVNNVISGSGCSQTDVTDEYASAQQIDIIKIVSDQCITTTSDQDWYQVYAAVGSPIKFDLAVPAGKNYDLELFGPFTPGGTPPSFIKASRNATGLAETISHTALASGSYMVRIISPNSTMDASTPYSLIYTAKMDTVVPTIAITVPATNGASVQGQSSISGTAADSVGLSKIKIMLNGNLLTELPGAVTWSYTLDTAQYQNQTYTLTAVAVDTSGNESISATRTIFVGNSATQCLSRIAGTSTTNAFTMGSSAINDQCLTNSQDAHWYKVTAGAGTTLKLDLISPPGRKYDVEILGPDNYNAIPIHLAQTATQTTGQSVSVSTVTKAAGLFYAKVFSLQGNFDNTVPYNIQYTPPPSLPDLTISLSGLSSSYISGQPSVTATVKVDRTGAQILTGQYVNVALYISPNPTWDASAQLLWVSNNVTPNFPIAPLNANGTVQTTATFSIPVKESGVYYIHAYADPPTQSYGTGFFSESDKQNNNNSSQVTIGGSSSNCDQFGNIDISHAKELSVDAQGVPDKICQNTQSHWFKFSVGDILPKAINITPTPTQTSINLLDVRELDPYFGLSPISHISGSWKVASGNSLITCPFDDKYLCRQFSVGHTYYVEIGRQNASTVAEYTVQIANSENGFTVPATSLLSDIEIRKPSGQIVNSGDSIWSYQITLYPKFVNASQIVRFRFRNSSGVLFSPTPVMSFPGRGLKIQLSTGTYTVEYQTYLSADWQQFVKEGNPFKINITQEAVPYSYCGSKRAGDRQVFLCDALDTNTWEPLGDGDIPLILIHGICGVTGSCTKTISENGKLTADQDYPWVWEDFKTFFKNNEYQLWTKKFKLYIFRYETAAGMLPYGAINDKEIGQKLRDYAEELGLNSKEIYILAHSNGGLVARAFMQETWSNNVQCGNSVKKIITISTPHQGANDLNKLSSMDLYVKGVLSGLGDFGHLDPAIQNDLSNSEAGFWSTLNSFYDKIVALYSKSFVSILDPLHPLLLGLDHVVPESSGGFQRRLSESSTTGFAYGPFDCLYDFEGHTAMPANHCVRRGGFMGLWEIGSVFDYVTSVLNNSPIPDGVAWKKLTTQFSASGTRNLSASSLSQNITWHWADVENATSYRIADSSGVPISDYLPGGTTTWVEPNLEANTVYLRKVLAYTDSGLLSASIPTLRSTLALSPDEANAAVSGITQIRVSWHNPGNPGDTSYRVSITTVPAFATNISEYYFTGNSTVNIKGLIPDATYYLSVVGVNRDGLSDQTVNYSTVSMPSMPKAFTISDVNTSAARYFGADMTTSIYLDSAPAYGSTLFISTDPLSVPVEIASTEIASANTELKNKYNGCPGTVREFVVYSGSAAYENELSGSITIPFKDDNDDGIVDGTFPEVKVADLRPYTWHNGKWAEVEGPFIRDTVNYTITFPIAHLSIYALGGLVTTQSQPALNSARVYPVPWQPGSSGKFGSANVAGCGSGLIFDNLTSEGTIRIYTIPGDLVRDIFYTSADNGCKAWDGKNASGRNVASGVYIAIINNRGSGGGSKIKKLAIER